MDKREKICPICLAGGNSFCDAFCEGRDCMWFVEEKEDCAVHILAMQDHQINTPMEKALKGVE
jgi:hypothetical protein